MRRGDEEAEEEERRRNREEQENERRIGEGKENGRRRGGELHMRTYAHQICRTSALTFTRPTPPAYSMMRA